MLLVLVPSAAAIGQRGARRQFRRGVGELQMQVRVRARVERVRVDVRPVEPVHERPAESTPEQGARAQRPARHTARIAAARERTLTRVAADAVMVSVAVTPKRAHTWPDH